MRIKKIEIKNFKRFTDLTIADIPDISKLVLVIGNNGSGKSSLFDAFDWLSKGKGTSGGGIYIGNEFMNYYLKDIAQDATVSIEFMDGALIEANKVGIVKGRELAKYFVGRSSIRIIPHISNSANLAWVSSDADSPTSYIEHDTRFINDVFSYIRQINTALRAPVFSGQQADTLQIFRDSIEPLNNSLINIFGGDETTTIQIAEFEDAFPNTTAKLIFKKGVSKINYDLLSHGEKQVVILLINFIVRQQFYQNAIIFIDEMDCHLNTALQENLLREIVTRWIPNNAQLWTASHALGFIDYARNSEDASIIDLDLLNFDTKKELYPLSKDTLSVYDIAIPKSTITAILKGYKLVVVENTNAQYFNAALGDKGYLFLPAGNNREVFRTVKVDKDKIGLRDRDYLRKDEMKNIQEQFPKFKILLLYTFENYLYHPDNFATLNLSGFNRNDYIAEITEQKNEKVLYIVGEIGTARTHYVEFKECIKNDQDIQSIIDALRSNDFEDFYPYFNMKTHFNKKYLNSFKYSLADLATTDWFKNQILRVLG
ncbi:MAG: AAA family ATPase [Phycisphaerales bacterium]|nr:AAA family ATPase [Phycisphaerales bacterium]